jgi:hypothetical protein
MNDAERQLLKAIANGNWGALDVQQDLSAQVRIVLLCPCLWLTDALHQCLVEVLCAACAQGIHLLVKLLVSRGANLEARNIKGVRSVGQSVMVISQV